MKRIRTIPQAVSEIVSQDPNSAITEYFVRSLVKTDAIPYLTAGSKVMIDLDILLDYIDSSLTTATS